MFTGHRDRGDRYKPREDQQKKERGAISGVHDCFPSKYSFNSDLWMIILGQFHSFEKGPSRINKSFSQIGHHCVQDLAALRLPARGQNRDVNEMPVITLFSDPDGQVAIMAYRLKQGRMGLGESFFHELGMLS
ncbi:MAG: hypothetical protein ACK2T3_09685 [Candidatus Promineifilaceae bacterium]